MTTAQKSEYESTKALPSQEHHAALPAPEEPKKGSILRKIIIFLIVAGFVGGAYWKISANRKAAAEQGAGPGGPGGGARRGGGAGFGGPISVAATPVVQRTVPIYFTALGTVTAYNTVTIRSRVDGQLMSVNVREGQQVNQGQSLIQIDPAPYQAALAVAEGNLARDQAIAVNARQQATRYDQLYAAGVVSREQAQTQDAAAGQAEGSVKADQAAIQTAKVNLNYTRIVSPISGVVGLRQVDPGNIVSASSTTGLLVVTQLHPIAVIFTLPEDQLPDVLKLTRAGKRLAVEAFDRSNTTVLDKGYLLTTDNQIDTTTGTAKLKAVFENKTNSLFPNQFVNVRLVMEDRPNSLVVPASAVQTGTQGSFMYIVKDGTPPAQPEDGAGGPGGGQGGGRRGGQGGGAGAGAGAASGQGTPGQGAGRRNGQGGPSGGQPQGPPRYVEVRNIKIAMTQGGYDIIADGVKPGELVVTDGAERLRNYNPVIVRQANPATGNAIPVTPGQGGQGGGRGRGANGAGGPGPGFGANGGVNAGGAGIGETVPKQPSPESVVESDSAKGGNGAGRRGQGATQGQAGGDGSGRPRRQRPEGGQQQ